MAHHSLKRNELGPSLLELHKQALWRGQPSPPSRPLSQGEGRRRRMRRPYGNNRRIGRGGEAMSRYGTASGSASGPRARPTRLFGAFLGVLAPPQADGDMRFSIIKYQPQGTQIVDAFPATVKKPVAPSQTRLYFGILVPCWQSAHRKRLHLPAEFIDIVR